jgi:peptidoglycan-associated lipoprotein
MKKMNLFVVLFLIFSVGIYIGCDKKQVVKTDEATQEGSAKAQAASAKEDTAFKGIYFDFNKAAILSGDREVLKQIAEYLLKNKNVKITIEGNCDERGTDKYNLVLGGKRAKAAMNYLVNLGVEKKRIKTLSNGKRKPLDPGHNEEAWAKNRRDDFVANMK